MKKILAIILALACTFSLFSCGDDEIAKVKGMFDASVPTKIVTTTEQSIGDGSIVLNGYYELVTGTIYTGTSSSVATVSKYTYEELNTVEEGSGESAVGPVKTVNGSKEFMAGKGIRVDGGSWTEGYNFAPSAGSISLNLTKKLLAKSSYKDHVFTCTVSPKNASKVLNMEISASSDVQITVKDNGAEITYVSITYTVVDVPPINDKTGKPEREQYPDTVVTIETVYSYGLQEVDLVK